MKKPAKYLLNLLKSQRNDWFVFAKRLFFCRDYLFHGFLNSKIPYRNLYFISDNVNYIKIFLEEFEERANIPPKVRLKISTYKKRILRIGLNSFWRHPLRFSLLTALVRAGVDYTGEAFNSHITKSKYFKPASKSVVALRVFMKGCFGCEEYQIKKDMYDRFVGLGWCNFFNTNQKTPKELLN